MILRERFLAYIFTLSKAKLYKSHIVKFLIRVHIPKGNSLEWKLSRLWIWAFNHYMAVDVCLYLLTLYEYE